MRDTKGFTLVELLAVIVILAIVALITTPAILNVINNSRLEGAKDKAWGTIKSVQLAYTQAQTIDNYTEATSSSNGITVDADANTITVDFSSGIPKFGARSVTFTGETPKSGQVIINTASGQITCKDLEFTGNGHYKCTTTDGKTMDCPKA